MNSTSIPSLDHPASLPTPASYTTPAAWSTPAVLTEPWHLLQRSDALDEELAAALAGLVPVILWEPHRSLSPLRPRFQEDKQPLADGLHACTFPLLRGFARLPAACLTRTGAALAARLARHCARPERSTLLCNTSLFAGVAEHWKGPVVYWLTDLMVRYDGLNPRLIRALDRRLCRRADLVCPNSHRIARYLREEAGCPDSKIEVLPNATRPRSVLPTPSTVPDTPPSAYAHLPQPLAGVIGNLSENMDWLFLQRLLELTPWLSWAFVGPTAMPVRDRAQRRAREAVMRHPRTVFTGSQPHAELATHDRAFSVAVLPYLRREPTFSGSSTRFYEHLAAGHPILATPGVAELLTQEPLLTLVPTPEDAALALDTLRACNFNDGLRSLRWKASQQNTWRHRALTLHAALNQRLSIGD